MGDAGLTKLRSLGMAVTSGMARYRGSRVVRARLVSICWFCLPGQVMGVSAPRGPLPFRFMCSQSSATPVEGQLSFPVVLIKVSGLTLTVHAALNSALWPGAGRLRGLGVAYRSIRVQGLGHVHRIHTD